MKSFVLIGITLLIIGATQFIDFSKEKIDKKTGNYSIAIHGGAGTISKDLPDSVIKEYIQSLTDALKLGQNILEMGGTSLDAVEQVVRFLEDDPKFNAGRGAVFTSEGMHELDASIMNGKDLSSGAVASVKGVKNPISLARLVMEKTPHVLLTGSGAEEFGKKMNVNFMPQDYFHTKKRYEQWQKKAADDKKGTGGCVALDKFGNLAAATSTGGTTNKMPGRVGDSPLINAGTYANNKTCAVSGTGIGEIFIANTVAFNISALMEYKGYSLKQAADEIIHKRLNPGDGGIIAVDKDENIEMSFNSPGMFRGAANSDGYFEIKIWED